MLNDTCAWTPNNLLGLGELMFCVCVTAQVLVMLQFPNPARNRAAVLREEEEQLRCKEECIYLQGICVGFILAIALAFFVRWLY